VEKLKFEFPDTGEGVTEGTFLEWKVKEGDEIEEDQIVGEAETDKAVVEIPAPADGNVKSLKVGPGDKVDVGEVIMELDTGDVSEGEADESGPEAEEKNTGEKDENDQKSEEAGSEKEPEKSKTSGDVLALPKVRKLAEEKGVDLTSLKTGERITEEEVREAAGEERFEKEESGTGEEAGEVRDESSEEVDVSQEVDATPAVRKLAREEGVDISRVEGSGRGGKVTRQDVLDFEGSEAENEKDTREESHETEVEGDVERVEMNGVKRKTAEKMSESKFSAPHVTHMDKADVTELVELRESVKEDIDEHLTYLPFIMKACYLAMQEHPNLNAELDEEKDEIVRKKFYDFNIAVDTERGLMVPKVEGVDEKNLVELAGSISDVVEKAQSENLSVKEMQGGTFSITNIGAIGGRGFTPIINPPQSAILGVGKIEETAEVVDGEVVPRNTVKLSLSYDHRVIDGAEAARFMNEVIENLEKPEEMLMEV
jgi:pyruvate dehydrogenase E2 component (dihydrolipoamide acetyltransferase)